MRKNRTNSSGKSLYGKRRKGFTIVELVIVIAVIAILAAVLVPTLSAVVQKAKDSQELQNEKANETNYIASDSTVIGEDFDITKPLTEYYDILSFDAPTLLSTYNQNKERHDGTTTSESYFAQQTTAYYVGDDNEFIFEPIMTARHIVTYEILTLTGFNVAVEVTYSGNTLNATENADGTIGYYDTTNTSTLYVTFNPETYGFKFDETNATGKSFTLKMTLLDSYLEDGATEYKAIEENYYKNTISPFEMTVTVADGWNVYNALDLGRMCIVSSEITSSDYHRAQAAFNNYYSSSTWTSLNYSKAWKNFLDYEYGEVDPVNGIFIHANITVTSSDIPSEYIVSAEEAQAVTKNSQNNYNYNYSDMIGSVRDWSLIYVHYMTSDFTFNGNLFKIDFSNLKWGMSNSSITGFFYAEGSDERFAGHSSAIAFIGAKTGTQYTTTFTNVESTGNSNGILNADDENGTNASGSLMFLKNIHTTTEVNNCITKNYLIGYFSEITPDSYSTSVTATGKSSGDNYYGFKIKNTKIYDCYNSAIFAWESANNTVTTSEMKRFGGPAVLLVGGTNAVSDSGSTYKSSGCTVDSATTIESEIAGGEAWFKLNNADNIDTLIQTLAGYISTYTTGVDTSYSNSTILTSSNTVNLYSILIDYDYLSSSSKYLYGDFVYGDGTALSLDATTDATPTTTIEQINNFLSSTSYKAPVFMTDKDLLFTTDGSGFYGLSDYLTYAYQVNQDSSPSKPTAITSLGDATTLYVIYPLGNTIVAFAVELNPN